MRITDEEALRRGASEIAWCGHLGSITRNHVYMSGPFWKLGGEEGRGGFNISQYLIFACLRSFDRIQVVCQPFGGHQQGGKHHPHWEGYQLWGLGLVWNWHGNLVFNWELLNCKEHTFFICRFIEIHIPINLILSYWLGTQSLSITQPHPHPIDVYSACCSKYFPAYFTQPEPKPWQRLRPVLSILCMLLQNYSSLKIENFWAAETPKKSSACSLHPQCAHCFVRRNIW